MSALLAFLWALIVGIAIIMAAVFVLGLVTLALFLIAIGFRRVVGKQAGNAAV